MLTEIQKVVLTVLFSPEDAGAWKRNRQSAYRKEWLSRNPEKRRSVWTEWNKKNPTSLKRAQTKWSAENRELRKNNYLEKQYGMTLAEFNQTLQGQGGGCAICNSNTKRMHVDHDHETGRVRGILCARCNLGVGYFKDTPDNCRKAAEYLEKYANC